MKGPVILLMLLCLTTRVRGQDPPADYFPRGMYPSLGVGFGSTMVDNGALDQYLRKHQKIPVSAYDTYGIMRARFFGEKWIPGIDFSVLAKVRSPMYTLSLGGQLGYVLARRPKALLTLTGHLIWSESIINDVQPAGITMPVSFLPYYLRYIHLSLGLSATTYVYLMDLKGRRRTSAVYLTGEAGCTFLATDNTWQYGHMNGFGRSARFVGQPVSEVPVPGPYTLWVQAGVLFSLGFRR